MQLLLIRVTIPVTILGCSNAGHWQNKSEIKAGTL